MRRMVCLPFILSLALLVPARGEEGSDEAYAAHVAAGKEQYFKKGNIYRATWEFREAMRMKPGSREAYRAMGACLVRHGDRERGIFYLNESLKRAPDDALTFYWLGMGYTNDKKTGLAYACLAKAKALLKVADFPDQATYENSVKNCDMLLADAEREGGAKFAADAFGAPAKMFFEYAGNLYGEVTQLSGSSAEVGQPIVKGLLLVQLWDADGRVLDVSKLSIAWTASAGFTGKNGDFNAGDKPGRETITVTEAGSKLNATVGITVLGPAVKIALSPEAVSIAQNQRQTLEARAMDAAGNTVLAPTLNWSVSEGAGLSRAETSQDAVSMFEPHRNSYEAPENAAAGSVSVTVSSADGKLSAVAKIAIEKRKMDKLQSRAKAVTWESLSLEDAIKKAAQSGKPLLVEITASWCPFCKHFEEGPLSDPKVGEALKDWLAVQIDADQHPELVSRYGVDDLPMVALLSPNGTLAGGFGNNLEPTGTDPRTTTPAFLKAVTEAKSNAPKLDADEAAMVAGAKDAGKMQDLARWYWYHKRWADAEKWARDAVKADAKMADAMEPYLVWVPISYGRHEEAIKEADAFLAAHPASGVAAEISFYRGQAFVNLKQNAKAKAAFAEIQKKWPGTSWASKAAAAAKK